MTISSKGYAGPVTSDDWAVLARSLGKRYWVEHSSSAQPVVNGSSARTVTINTGFVGGYGVIDEITAAEDVQINADLPTTGNTKWFLIALRRDWGAGESELVVIPGTGSMSIPVRQQSPGTGQDDQPLALVQITGGNNNPTALVDLRAWGGEGGAIMQVGWNSGTFRQYINWQGALVRWRNEVWCYLQGAPGNGETGSWQVISNQEQKLSGQNAFASSATGWGVTGSGSRMYRKGKMRVFTFRVNRVNGQPIESDSRGSITSGDEQMARLHPADRPHIRLGLAGNTQAVYAGGGGGERSTDVGLMITPAGWLTLTSMLPNNRIPNGSGIEGAITYFVE